jgi:hypothetical protein
MKWWRALRYWRNAMHRFDPTGKVVPSSWRTTKAIATLASII